MVKMPTLKRPDANTYRGWGFVLVAGALLGVVALFDRGSVDPLRADGTSGCQLEVTAEVLNVRTGPALETATVEVLQQGAVVDGTAVVTDGYRQLEDGRWVADEYVTPTSGSDCS